MLDEALARLIEPIRGKGVTREKPRLDKDGESKLDPDIAA